MDGSKHFRMAQKYSTDPFPCWLNFTLKMPGVIKCWNGKHGKYIQHLIQIYKPSLPPPEPKLGCGLVKVDAPEHVLTKVCVKYLGNV